MVSDETSDQRREVCYCGRVQGIGFRYTVRSLAKRFVVTGFVRNLPDGRVELVAEGSRSQIRMFLDTVRSEMGNYVTDVQEKDLPATGQFRGFDIRF